MAPSGIGVALVCTPVTIRGKTRPMVTVKAIDPQGPAALSSLRAGDVILGIDGRDATALDLLVRNSMAAACMWVFSARLC